MLTPSMFSGLKYKAKGRGRAQPLYKLAERGIVVDL
jgi:hypothetical protein